MKMSTAVRCLDLLASRSQFTFTYACLSGKKLGTNRWSLAKHRTAWLHAKPWSLLLHMCESTWSQVKQFEEHYDDIWHNYDIPPHATKSHCTCCMRRPSWVRKNCIGHRQSKSLRMLLVKQRPRPAQLEHPLTARIGSHGAGWPLPPSTFHGTCSLLEIHMAISKPLNYHLNYHLKFVKHLRRCLIFGLLWTYFGRHIMSDARGAAASAFVVW